MDALLSALSSGESKARAEAFQNLADGLRKGRLRGAEDNLDELCRRIAEALKDNNVKVSTSACDALSSLCDSLADPEALGSFITVFVEPLCDLLGAAKSSSRDSAYHVALSLMTATGDPADLMHCLVTKHAKHKNWRVRESVLALYTAQVLAYGKSAYLNETDVLKAACDALGDAQPEVRKAAMDGLAALGLQLGLTQVLSKAGEKGARPAHLTSIRERFSELSESAGDLAPTTEPSPVPEPAALPAPTPKAAAARPTTSAAAPGARPAPVSQPPTSDVGATRRPATAATADGPPSRRPAPIVASQSKASVYRVPFEAAVADQYVMNLTQMNSSDLWRPGVLGFEGDAGTVKPVIVGNTKDLQKAVEGIISVCATTSADWSARTKALDTLRGLILGGAVGIDGFPACMLRLKDSLTAQVQELRSSVAKQACLAAAELSAVTAHTAWMETLAEPLVEVCLKLTAVSIAVISTSAHWCIQSLLHNTKVGFHRVVPKLCAGCRSKSAVTRANSASYLLRVLRGWHRATLERHLDEICVTVIALIRDADKDARSAGRSAFWCLKTAFPARADGVLSALDMKLQRAVASDEAFEAAQADAVSSFCEPVQLLDEELMAEATPMASAVSTPLFSASFEADRAPPASRAGIRGGAEPQASSYAVHTGAGASRVGGGGEMNPPVRPPTALPPRSQPHTHTQQPAASSIASAPASRVPTPAAAPPLATPTSAFSAPKPTPTASIPTWARETVEEKPVPLPPAPVSSHDAVPAEPHLSQSLAQTFSLVSNSINRMMTVSAAHVHPLREAFISLISLLISLHAVDARSVARAYAERLPPSLSELQSAGVIPAWVEREFAVSTSGTQPLLCEDNLTPEGVIALCRHIAGDAPRATSLLPAAILRSPTTFMALTSMLPEIIRLGLSHPHENVQLDALALLFALLDACVGIDSSVADVAADVSAPRGEFADADHSAIRLFSVKVAASGAPGSYDFVSTAIPVYARCFLHAGGHSPANPDDLHSPVFLDIFHLIVAHSTSLSEVHRTMSRRVISAMRRAFSAPVLLACTIFIMNRPLSLSTAGEPAGDSTSAGAGARTQAASLMLALSLLGDAGAAEHVLSRATLLTRLIDGAAKLLTPSLVSSLRIHVYADQVLSLLWKSDSEVVRTSVLSLSSGSQAALCQYCDADAGYGGSIPMFMRTIRTSVASGAATPGTPDSGFVAVIGTPAQAGKQSHLTESYYQVPAPVAAPQRPATASAPSSYASSYAQVSSMSAPSYAAAPAPAQQPMYAPAPAPTYMPAPIVSAPAPAPAPAIKSTFYPPAPAPAPAAPSVLPNDPNPRSLGDPSALPLTRGNLELVREALSSPDKERVTRALHFLGRSVDGAAPPPTMDASKPLSNTPLPLPETHRGDTVYLSMFERVISGVLACIASSSASSCTEASFTADQIDAVMLQTSLSVLRKLFRNGTAYMVTSSGAVLQTLLHAFRFVNRDIGAVLERTVDECMERMPAELLLSHFVSAVVEAPVDATAVTIAAIKGVARFIPRFAATLVIAELNKGRLMEAVAQLFLSTSTDVRRAVVQLLVNLHLLIGAHFVKFAESYLSIPQQKLLAIYLEKESAAKAVQAAIR